MEVELANMYNTKQHVSLKITINRKTGRKVTKVEPLADNLTSVVKLDCVLTDKYRMQVVPTASLISRLPPKNKGENLGTRLANCSAVLYVLTS